MEISPAAWVIIIFVLFIVLMNIWLFTSLNKKKQNNEIEILKRVTGAIKDPFAAENQQLEELSRMTSALKNNKKEP